ncbi:MAG: FMN-dependent NADH-azoreductase [Burkholderiales bacterium]|nr:FMN-dependent NADH-azoreductase [Burkholderiales bacterium]
MKTILQLNSSLNGPAGHSSRLADALVARLRAQYPGARLVVRDLAREPVPHLDAERFGAFTARERSAPQQAVVDYSDMLIDELRRADLIVLAVPMYNFGVPSPFKAWIDHVARAGVTFRYTDKGSIGLLGGRKVYVVSTRGGRYAGTGTDTETPYLRQVLGFLGITDVEFIVAEGLALGDASREAALAAARAEIGRIGREAALAA